MTNVPFRDGMSHGWHIAINTPQTLESEAAFQAALAKVEPEYPSLASRLASSTRLNVTP